MAFFETALGGTVLNVGKSLLSGIFGGRSAKKQLAAQLKLDGEKFIRLRDAAEAGGFNPLTALGSGLGSSGVLANSGATLATQHSVDGALESVGDLLSGRKAQEIAADKKRAELLDLELQTFKAGSAFMQDPGAAPIRTAAAGERFNTRVRPQATPTALPAGNPREELMTKISSDREQMVMPVSAGPGMTVIDNDLLEIPVVVPGADGEPWGFDEVLTAGIFGAPQVLEHKIKTDPWSVVRTVQDNIAPWRKFIPKFRANRGDYVDPNTPFQMWRE